MHDSVYSGRHRSSFVRGLQQPAIVALYFPDLTEEELNISGKLSPKILIVAPNKRLSWQYHHRRAEIWKLIGGTAGVVTSDTDEEKETKDLSPNERDK